jgi:succinate dehydrogenase / fumarate reductase cytochrome b subunit
MLQHLTLNSFSLASPEKFNGVIHFFESIPKHFLLTLEIFGVWLPLLFHAIYGLFIVNRAKPNFVGTKYGWSQNRMYSLQRWSGILVFLFLIYHVISTTGAKYMSGSAEVIEYAAMQSRLTANGYALFVVYLVGIAAATYHFAYGIWNFCIRWGITISDKAQANVQKISFGLFIGVTLLGWAALAGFLIHKPGTSSGAKVAAVAPAIQQT